MADDPKQPPKELNIGMTELHSAISALNDKLDQMLANVQAYVWPSMGNSQKFSAE